jgi:anti-sigma-K factor RskA
MIPEERQDEALAYWWGEGSPTERAQFEEALRQDPELAAFVHGLAATAERLLESPAEPCPTPELRERILRIPREMERVPVPHMEIPTGKRRAAPFLVAMLAGIFATALVLIALDDEHVRDRAKRLEVQMAAAEAKADETQAKLAQEQREVAVLMNRSGIGALRMASLSAQNPALAAAKVTVVWDAGRQEGMVNLDGLPRPAQGKDYQLWVIDASSPNPVGAGTLSPDKSGKLVKAFRPDRPVVSAQKFAVTIEPSGGSRKPTGPAVFVGG